jgi:hypothetical protein
MVHRAQKRERFSPTSALQKWQVVDRPAPGCVQTHQNCSIRPVVAERAALARARPSTARPGTHRWRPASVFRRLMFDRSAPHIHTRVTLPCRRVSPHLALSVSVGRQTRGVAVELWRTGRRPPRQWPLSGSRKFEGDRLDLAGQRSWSPSASGLIVVGRSSTRRRRLGIGVADVCESRCPIRSGSSG